MCATILDNWFGIDRPSPQQTPVINPLPPQIANPNAGDTQVNLSPTDNTVMNKKRGAAALRIDRTSTVGNSGLNIPQA